MDIVTDKVRVNLEEAIAAIQAVRVLKNLSIKQVDWYSYGLPVEIIDYNNPTHELDPCLYIEKYLEDSNFIITPTIQEKSH